MLRSSVTHLMPSYFQGSTARVLMINRKESNFRISLSDMEVDIRETEAATNQGNHPYGRLSIINNNSIFCVIPQHTLRLNLTAA